MEESNNSDGGQWKDEEVSVLSDIYGDASIQANRKELIITEC